MELPPSQFKGVLPVPIVMITNVDADGVGNSPPYGCVMPIL